jgi:4-hydroxy-2-oxoheptanedioate aldolase
MHSPAVIPSNWSLLFLILTSMATSSLRHRLQQGGRSYGPMLLSDSPVVAEVMALAGYGHIVVDHEHSPTDIRSGQAMLQAIQSTGTPTEPIVRLPAHDTIYMKKVLDSLRLPAGVLVPMVEDAEMARAVVRSTRYPRQYDEGATAATATATASTAAIDRGLRGCAAPFIRASGWGTQANYLTQCREDLLVMVQVETPTAVDAIPEIAAIPGIDGIFLGPMDLSCSLGKMGRFNDANVIELLARAESLVRDSPAFLAGFRSPGRSIEEMYSAGYRLVCGSVDLGLLRDAAMKDAAAGNPDR